MFSRIGLAESTDNSGWGAASIWPKSTRGGQWGQCQGRQEVQWKLFGTANVYEGHYATDDNDHHCSAAAPLRVRTMLTLPWWTATSMTSLVELLRGCRWQGINYQSYKCYYTIAGKVTSGLWGKLNSIKNVKPILITMYNDNLVQWRSESSKKNILRMAIRIWFWRTFKYFDAHWILIPGTANGLQTRNTPEKWRKGNNKTFTEQTWCWCPHNLKEPRNCLFVGRIFVHKTFQGMSWILRASPL